MNNNDTYYLERCKRMIEQKLNWLPAEEWRNYEFNELSDKILDTTGINLSATTLKRIFGKLKYESLPSSVTLNALAAFLGYKNWMDFKSGLANTQESESAPKKEEINIKKETHRYNRKTLFAATVVLALILVFGFILLSGKSSPVTSLPKDIVFTSRSLAEGLPNSVLFKFDLKGIVSENMFIQQSWDSTKTIKIKPGQTEATGFYYFPGYFRAKLIVDRKILKEHDLFIKAEKWMATVDHTPVPDYLEKDELILDNSMTVSEKALNEIKKISIPTNLTYHLVKPFGLASDNFSLETTVKNIYNEGPAVCATVIIYILCSKGALIIPFTIPGCVGNMGVMLNDKFIDGRSSDLSGFGTDLSQWNKVNVEVRNRDVKIFLNGNLVRAETYKIDAGQVVGLRFKFLGAGAVGKVKLVNGSGELVHQDQFK